MPVLTWKRMVALAFLGSGVLAVIVGVLAPNSLLLTGGALAVAGAIGVLLLGTYRRAGFAIHYAAQRHEHLLALAEAVSRLETRMTAMDFALRQTIGRDLQSLVLNAFRDVDDRVDELARQINRSRAASDDRRKEMDSRLASIDRALCAVGVDLQKDVDRIAGKPLRALAREIGGGRLRYDLLNDASSMQHLQKRLPLSAPAPLISGWSLEPSSLAELLELVLDRKPGLVVECGSGVSTVWLARAAATYGGRVVALEHLEEYADLTRADLFRHGLGEVAEVRFTQLDTYELSGREYRWYDRHGWSDLEDIGLLMVDGPPKATGPRARYPALPLLRRALTSAALVVLDDIHREEEREVLADWRAETGGLGPERLLGPRTVLMEWQPATDHD